MKRLRNNRVFLSFPPLFRTANILIDGVLNLPPENSFQRVRLIFMAVGAEFLSVAALPANDNGIFEPAGVFNPIQTKLKVRLAFTTDNRVTHRLIVPFIGRSGGDRRAGARRLAAADG